MSYELRGVLLQKFDSVQVTEKFKKRDFIFEHHEVKGKYEQVNVFKCQLANDKCSLIDEIKTGTVIDIQFNLRGTKYDKPGKETMYFTQIDVWKINVPVDKSESNHAAPPQEQVEPEHISDNLAEGDDSLPF